MWRDHLKGAVRALVEQKGFAFLNIFGLALGLAACLLLLLYVRYESRYDRWLPGWERVYQVQTVSADPADAQAPYGQYVHGAIADSLAGEFTEIEAIARLDEANPVFLRDGQPSFAPMLLADESFFRIVQLPFLRGNPDTALARPDGLTLSRSEALARFGSLDILGETVTAVRAGETSELTVTGVFEDLPRNSHMRFAIVGRLGAEERAECGWGCIGSFVYLKLREGADPEAIHRRLPAWESRLPPVEVGGEPRREGDRFDWRLVNIADVHLSGAAGAIDQGGNDRRTLVTFALVALLILAMAAINAVNLATARASRRAREVALRKVLGASRGQLVLRFLSEAFLLAGIAVAIALVAVELALPWFSAFLDSDLKLAWLGVDGALLPALGLWLVVGLAAGLYPALHLSRYRPAEVLKANRSMAEPIGTGRLRSVLVVAQFAVSIALIVCTLVVYAQTLHAGKADLGYRREGLIQVANANRAAIIPQTETLMRRIAAIEGVESVAGTNIASGSETMLTTSVRRPGRPEPEVLGLYSVSPEFFATMGVRLIAGRALSRRLAADDASVPLEPEEAFAAGRARLAERGMNVVVNRSAARRVGFADPEQAVGGRIAIALFGADEALVPAEIVGVVEDSRFRSLRDPIEPMIFFDRRIYNNLAIRYRADDPETVRRRIGEVWRELAPDVPFEAEFAEQRLARLHAADRARAQAFAGFAGLAILIACLGLFGLAAFTAERRTKEIGIRKVFGARAHDIVALLAWQFAKPVMIANLIAWPVAWWAMRDWLNGFDERIALGPGPFLVAGLVALAIAVGTVAGHAVRVARTNPIHALRYE